MHRREFLFGAAASVFGLWMVPRASRKSTDGLGVFRRPAARGPGSLVVAAADTPASIKERADYVCDGTNVTGGDEEELNEALRQAPSVVLAPGTFWLSGGIVLPSNRALSGCGPASVIKLRDRHNASIDLISNEPTNAQYGVAYQIVIERLTIHGNGNSISGPTQRGILLTHVTDRFGHGAFALAGATIAHCTIYECRTGAIEMGSCQRCTIIGNHIVANGATPADGAGIQLVDCHYCVVQGNQLFANSSWAIRLSSCTRNLVVGNMCVESDDENLLLVDDSRENVVAANVTARAGGEGLELQQSTHNVVADNVVTENSMDPDPAIPVPSMSVNLFSAHNVISSNNFHVGKAPARPSYAIEFQRASARNLLHGNSFYEGGAQGDVNDLDGRNGKRDNRNIDGEWLEEY